MNSSAPAPLASTITPADFAVPVPEDLFEPDQLRDLHPPTSSDPLALPSIAQSRDCGTASGASPESSSSSSSSSSSEPESNEPESESLSSQPSPLNSPAAAPIPSQKRYRHHWTPFQRRQGRPTRFHPDLVDDIYETIERYGYSDSAAAHAHDVSTSTISRWKQSVPNFTEFLETARDKFENAQVHKIEAFVRRDGQADPKCAMWLLERSNPEKWGRPATRRGGGERDNGCGAHGASNATSASAAKPKAELKKEPKAPKPGTPEYWDYVEEEPFPRNLSTCIITPGRQKFFSILHLTKLPYLPGPGEPDPTRDQPSVELTPEHREATREAFFKLQEHYFALPKDQRITFLHQLYQLKYGKILPEHQILPENAPPDAPSDAATSRSGGALAEPAEAAASGIEGAVRTGREVEVLVVGRGELGETESHQNDIKPVGSDSPQQSKTTQNCPESQAGAATQPEIAEAASGVPHAAQVDVSPVIQSGQNSSQNDINHDNFASPQQSKSQQNCPESQAGAAAQPEIAEAASGAPRNRKLETAPSAPPTVIREKLPSEYTREENIAFFHHQARLVAERRAREVAALFNYDDEDDPGWDDDFD